MQKEHYEYQPLRKQNFRLIGWVCLIAILFVLTKTFFTSSLPETVAIAALAIEQLMLAWVIYQLGIYTDNFDESSAHAYTTIFAYIILLKLAYSIVITYSPQFQYMGLMLLFNTLFISLYFFVGRAIMALQNDFVGGLKYIGILFVAKAGVIFVGLLTSVGMAYLVDGIIPKSIVNIIWIVTNYLTLFIDFAIFYILFKIFRKADLTQ